MRRVYYSVFFAGAGAMSFDAMSSLSMNPLGKQDEINVGAAERG